MGTFLHAKGSAAGECPESWCVSHPDVVKDIAEAYVAAGSDIVETNSFGGSAFKLKPYGFAGQGDGIQPRLPPPWQRRLSASKGYVAASVGPTGQIVEDEGGDVSQPQSCIDAFKEQVSHWPKAAPTPSASRPCRRCPRRRRRSGQPRRTPACR